MGGGHHVLMPEQDVLVGRLPREHVEGGARHLARLERLVQVRLLDQPAARAIDDAHARLHATDRLGIDDAPRRVGEWDVKGDEIGPAEQLVERHLLDMKRRGPFGREVGIVGDHLHAQAERPLGHESADVAAADYRQGLAGELDSHEARFLPLARLGRAVCGGNLAGEGEEEGDGVLGRGDGVAVGRVHHHDAAGRRRLDIDIVDPDAGAPHDPERPGPLEERRRHLGGRAHGEALVAADDGGERRRVEARAHLGRDAPRLEHAARGHAHLVGDQYLGHGRPVQSPTHRRRRARRPSRARAAAPPRRCAPLWRPPRCAGPAARRDSH